MTRTSIIACKSSDQQVVQSITQTQTKTKTATTDVNANFRSWLRKMWYVLRHNIRSENFITYALASVAK